MFRYIHNDTERQRVEIEEAVGGGILAEIENDVTRTPNTIKEVNYGGYWFTIEYVLADYSPLEAIGLHFRGEKFGLYSFYYTGYDELFIIARPFDYSFFRRARMESEDEVGTYFAAGFTVQEAEAIGKFFDANWPTWRTPFIPEYNDHDWYAKAMEDTYGEEAWGWDDENDRNIYL